MTNKSVNWIERMRDLRATEAEMPPFEPAWRKVEKKLGSKRNSRLQILYWAAAIIILVLILPRLLQQTDRKEKMIVGTPVPSQQKINPTIVAGDSNNAISKRAVIQHKNKIPNLITTTPDVAKVADTQNKIITNPVILKDTQLEPVFVQTKTKKRSLNVIHENELPDPSLPIQTTANTQYRLLPGFKEYERPEEPPVHSIHLNTQN